MSLFVLATPEQVVARVPVASPASAAAVLEAVARMLPYAEGGAFNDAMVVLTKELIGFEPMAELLCWFEPRAILTTLHDPEGYLPLTLQEFGLLADVEPTWTPDTLAPAGLDTEAALELILRRVRAVTGGRPG